MKEEHRDVDAAVVGADEIARAAAKRKIFLSDAKHWSSVGWPVVAFFRGMVLPSASLIVS